MPSAAANCARWRDQLESLLVRILATLDRHSGIARVPLANVPTGSNAAIAAERFRFGLRLMIEGLLHVPPPDIRS
jgi:hypothetical protein